MPAYSGSIINPTDNLAVRRAYLETWLLAFQFRLAKPPVPGQTGKWFARAARSWSADISKLDRYAADQGVKTPSLGLDYGGLSELAHPTLSAAENSASLITFRRGISHEAGSVTSAMSDFEGKDVPELLYRFGWLILDRRADFIPLSVNEQNMPALLKYVSDYSASLHTDQERG